MFFCKFYKILRTYFLLAELLQMTASCVDVQVAEFQPLDTVKNYFTVVFYTRRRDNHLKLFIYLKSLQNISE